MDFFATVARTGNVEEVKSRYSSDPSHEVLEAATEEDAIRIATAKFEVEAAAHNVRVKIGDLWANEIWSETDIIGWDVDTTSLPLT